MSLEQLDLISDRLESFYEEIPTDFARKPRSLEFVKKWKATECRQFLLYSGPVALKGIIDEEMYDNFITLHIAISLLTNPDRTLNLATLNLAQELLTDFINSFTAIYGSRYVSHKVHNILHVVEDVKKFGILDNFSAFDFESFIFFL